MRLTIERLFADPSLTGRVPTHVGFSPDGRRVSFLATAPDDRERLDLYAYDLESRRAERLLDARALGLHESSPTEAEKADRERRRFFATGITDYRWRPSGRDLVVVSGGRAYLASAQDGSARAVTPHGTRQTDVRLSPSGAFLSYVREGDLYVLDLETESETRLTFDGSDTIATGIADFIAQEEMHRFDGHWWACDDAWLLATRVDSSGIAITHRYEITADTVTVHPQRYPYAGARNAEVRLLMIDRLSGEQRVIEHRRDPEDYLARVSIGNAAFALLIQSRDQRRLRLEIHSGAGGPARVVTEDEWPTWLNLSSEPRFLPGSDELVWISERDGTARLYRSRGANDPVALTPKQGRVNRLVHVGAGHVYFLGWMETPVEQHLYRVATDEPTMPRRLTAAEGWHDAVVDAHERWFATQYSSLDAPARLDLGRIDGPGEHEPIPGASNVLDGAHPYFPYLATHSKAELGTLKAADGQTLWYRIARPRELDPGIRYPVIIDVYGGPDVQRVRNDWAPLAWQLFTQSGFVVFQLDNRGSGNRTKAFEDPLWHALGDVEAADQLAGAAFLSAQPWVDPRRIGIMGHSYGGYLTLRCLCRAPDTFRAGVAGAPVTDWRLYDTHYTERYLGTPQQNAEAYEASNAMNGIDRLKAPLLVIHGMADDNVLFTHSTLLFKTLQDRQIPFDMMTYPGAKHALQQPAVAKHRLMTILRFFERHLLS